MFQRNETRQQRANQQPANRRRIEHQDRDARGGVNQRALELFGIAGGDRNGRFFQWNISSWSHSLGRIEIVQFQKLFMVFGRERATECPAVLDVESVPPMQREQRRKIEATTPV